MLLIFSQLFLTPKMVGIVRKRSVNFPAFIPVIYRMRIMNSFIQYLVKLYLHYAEI